VETIGSKQSYALTWCMPNNDDDDDESVLNADAQLLFSARRSDHVTLLLRDLHWLKVLERIKFRLFVLMHHCLHGTMPPYLAN